MHYSLCVFTYGYEGEFYTEQENGYVIRFVDLSGSTINCPGAGEEGFKPYGYIIKEENPIQPFWAL